MSRKLGTHQEISMRLHNKIVRGAKANIDNRPPRLNVGAVTHFHEIKDDLKTLAYHRETHKNLLNRIFHMQRTRGAIDSFPKRKQWTNCRIKEKVATNKRLQEHNRHLARRLINVKAVTITRRSRHSIHMRKQRPARKFEVPYELLSKYSNLDLPEKEADLKGMLRPRIFFDLEVKGHRFLGRLVIELYTEASPMVVREFLRICIECQDTGVSVVRLFPSLWLECDLNVGPGSELGGRHEYDMRALDNNKGPGILSYSMDAFRPGFFKFAISFKPLCVVNGKRVAFGRVVSNLDVLSCIEKDGTKKGKLLREIVVTKCGLVNRDQCARKMKRRPSKSVRRSSVEMKAMAQKPMEKLQMASDNVAGLKEMSRFYVSPLN